MREGAVHVGNSADLSVALTSLSCRFLLRSGTLYGDCPKATSDFNKNNHNVILFTKTVSSVVNPLCNTQVNMRNMSRTIVKQGKCFLKYFKSFIYARKLKSNKILNLFTIYHNSNLLAPRVPFKRKSDNQFSP